MSRPIDIVATLDASNVDKGVKQMTSSLKTVPDAAGKASKEMGNLSDSTDETATKTGIMAAALSAFAGGLEAVGLGKYAPLLQGASVATDVFSNASDVATLALESKYVKLVRDKIATVASTTASIAASAATKTMAAGQWLLNAALTANPIGLVVVAIGLLVGAFILAWKNSETFRNVIVTGLSGVGSAALTMARVGVQAFKFLADAALDTAYNVVNAFAKIPGPQQKSMQNAAQNIKNFKASADASFNGAIGKLNQWDASLRNAPKVFKLQGNITDLEKKLATAKGRLNDKGLTPTKTAAIKADINQLERKIASAKAQINSIKGKTVPIVIKYSSTGVNLTTPSGVGRASGGPTAKNKTYIVGERGPELWSESKAGFIQPNHKLGFSGSSSMATSGGGAGVVVNINGGTFIGSTKAELQRWIRETLNEDLKVNGNTWLKGALAR